MESQRLIFRKMHDEDIDDFYEIFNSDKVDTFVKKMSRESVIKYFNKRKSKPNNPFSFAVILKDSGKMIGTCGIKTKLAEQAQEYGELSYVFNDKYWGKGYCTEACLFIIDYYFNNSGISLIKADCADTNLASIKILSEKLKMNFIAHVNDYGVDHHNETIKVGFNFYELSREQFYNS